MDHLDELADELSESWACGNRTHVCDTILQHDDAPLLLAAFIRRHFLLDDVDDNFVPFEQTLHRSYERAAEQRTD